jgi:hypothetical protein
MRIPFAHRVRELAHGKLTYSCCAAVGAICMGRLLPARLHIVRMRIGDTMENLNQSIKGFIADPVLQQRLAKYLVEQCFRNSELENLHAGKVPDSKTGDYRAARRKM